MKNKKLCTIQKIVTTRKQLFLSFVGILLISNCASILKESPELSQEVGHQLAAMRAAHMSLVHDYFDMKRAQLDRLFEEEWVPEYVDGFFGQEQTESMWLQVVEQDDLDQRLKLLSRLSPRMLEEIRRQRAEYMRPLNELERQIEQQLQQEYRQEMAASHILTSFFVSASEVSEDREEMLAEQSEMRELVDSIDKRSEQVMETIRNDSVGAIMG